MALRLLTAEPGIPITGTASCSRADCRPDRQTDPIRDRHATATAIAAVVGSGARQIHPREPRAGSAVGAQHGWGGRVRGSAAESATRPAGRGRWRRCSAAASAGRCERGAEPPAASPRTLCHRLGRSLPPHKPRNRCISPGDHGLLPLLQRMQQSGKPGLGLVDVHRLDPGRTESGPDSGHR